MRTIVLYARLMVCGAYCYVLVVFGSIIVLWRGALLDCSTMMLMLRVGECVGYFVNLVAERQPAEVVNVCWWILRCVGLLRWGEMFRRTLQKVRLGSCTFELGYRQFSSDTFVFVLW